MSTLDYRHLPEDRLSTTDKKGGRLWIIPVPVQGLWKKRRDLFQFCLLFIFVATPWLRLKGSPILLFDIANRQFVFFGKVFASHDGPLLFFIFAILGFGLITITALWGRVWCGWACPQTVFIEQVFRRMEFLILGSRKQQIEIYQNPLKGMNPVKVSLKWLCFVVFSLILAHSFMAYFVSWENLLIMMQAPPTESWTVFLFVFSITALVLFDFAWFREQFCIIMCPYGRFQSVLLDQNSVTVTYDYLRGEPRHKLRKDEPAKGDCVDCFKCVSVCPTGIDIRQGQQMECIGCTACIDACDDVMEKIQRPKGLIRYAALADIEKKGRVLWRPRVGFYLAIILILITGFLYTLSGHQDFYANVLRQNQRPYVVSGENLLNNFRLHLKNPSYQKATYKVWINSTEDLNMAPSQLTGEIEPNQGIQRPFFVKLTNWKSGKNKNFELVIEYRFSENDAFVGFKQKVQMVFPK